MIGYMFAIESTNYTGELPFGFIFFSYNLPLLRFGGCINYVPGISCNDCFANISNNFTYSFVSNSKTIH